MLKIILFLLINVFVTASVAEETASSNLQFTQQEKDYIASHPSIYVCTDPDWYPFEAIDQQDHYYGISADLIAILSHRIGIKILRYPTKTWAESIKASKAGLCETMSFLNQTPEREAWLDFTQPLLSDPNVIITREEHGFVADLKALSYHKVAIPRDTMIEERIQSDYPNLKMITTEDERESFRLIDERKADLTIRSLIIAAYTIRNEGWFNLKIAGQVPEYTNHLRMGVLKNQPILKSILDKGVATITPQERDAIVNNYINVKIEKNFDYYLVLQILIGSFLIFALLFWWIRKLNSLNKQLLILSNTDRLTGLYNRLKTDEALEKERMRFKRTQKTFGVILLDIDFFKKVNDQYGHQFGDDVLKAIANALQNNSREVDIIGRWGGEEFLIICPETDLEGLFTYAEKLRLVIANLHFANHYQTTASFGIACYQADEAVHQLIERADKALYLAKEQGRNQVVSG